MANVSQEGTLLALSIRLTWADWNRSTPGSVCLTCSRCRASKFIASVTAECSYTAINQSAAWHSTARGCTNGRAVYNCRKQSTNPPPAQHSHLQNVPHQFSPINHPTCKKDDTFPISILACKHSHLWSVCFWVKHWTENRNSIIRDFFT